MLCRPPGNRNPEPDEIEACEPFLRAQIEAVRPKVVVALGKFAWDAFWPAVAAVYGVRPPTPRPAFGHGVRVAVPGLPILLGSFHVSQQNTFTGRLTPVMLDAVLATAIEEAR